MDSCSKETLFKILKNESRSSYRKTAVKQIGRYIEEEDLPHLQRCIEEENNLSVKREIYSAVGRLKEPANIPILLDGLKNKSGKVVMQCLRGLLYHKDKERIRKVLEEFSKHSNEMIRDIIQYELGIKEEKEEDKPHPYTNPKLCQKFVEGDSNKVLSKIPENSVHLTFTSPPYYNARDYSTYKSYKEYIDFIIKIVQKIHRVTKKGRFFVLNTSPVLVPRFSRKHKSRRYLIPYDLHPKIIDCGFEFIEEILWKKPEASATNRNGGFYQHRKPLAYKANHCTESVIVYRKKTSKLIDWNLKQYSGKIIEESKIKEDYVSSNTWNIAPRSDSNHPAVFPEELAERVIKFYSMKKDLVMDPFAGSCTTAKSCLKLGRKFLMIEQDREYLNKGKKKALQEINLKNFNGDYSYLKEEEFLEQFT